MFGKRFFRRKTILIRQKLRRPFGQKISRVRAFNTVAAPVDTTSLPAPGNEAFRRIPNFQFFRFYCVIQDCVDFPSHGGRIGEQSGWRLDVQNGTAKQRVWHSVVGCPASTKHTGWGRYRFQNGWASRVSTASAPYKRNEGEARQGG